MVTAVSLAQGNGTAPHHRENGVPPSSLWDETVLSQGTFWWKLLLRWSPGARLHPLPIESALPPTPSFFSQRQVRDMDALQNTFTTSLAAADASLLQTNVLLQLMEKSQEVRPGFFSRKMEKHRRHRAGKP